jgi:hypothetical protein
MINSREFWNEAKSSFRLLISRPSFILTTAAPALIFSLILYMTPGRRLVWISSYLQSFTLAGLGIAGMFTVFLGMSFLIALVWDYQYRNLIDFRRVYRIIQSRFSDVLLACLGLGLLIGFFSVWFVFAGFFLAFLLIFCLPANDSLRRTFISSIVFDRTSTSTISGKKAQNPFSLFSTTAQYPIFHPLQ